MYYYKPGSSHNKKDKMKIKTVLGLYFIIVALAFFTGACNLGSGEEPAEISWDYVDEILKEIVSPVFPNRIFDVTDFGAVGDSVTLSTKAINRAIIECSEAGGGKVLIPKGIFLTGAVHLKSNVNLHLAEGAVLKFSRNHEDYLPVVFTRWEGTELYNYSPFIYAYEQKNIAITGEGKLDGQATSEHWWHWKGAWSRRTWEIGAENQAASNAVLRQMAENGVPVEERIFGSGHYLRPNFVQFYKCRNILMEGITIINSPMWVVHPVLSENITITNISVISHGPNNDGCNPESSRNILIQDSYFDTGDDCIAIKSGRNADGRRLNVPSENIIVRRCTMRDGHGGVVMGSEISGNVRNVFAEDCVMDSPNLDRIIRIKTNSTRGGIIENIFVRNINVGKVRQAILHIDFDYEEGDAGEFTPVVRNIHLENITSQRSERAIFINAYERSPVDKVHIKNCNFNGVEKENKINFVENLVLENVLVNGNPWKNDPE
jgi:polygalacturonase